MDKVNLVNNPEYKPVAEKLREELTGKIQTLKKQQILSPEEYSMQISGIAYSEGSGATGALKGRPVDVLGQTQLTFSSSSTGKLIIVPEEWEEFKAKGKKELATRAPVTYKITESRIDVLSPTVVNHHFIYNRKTVLAEDMSFQNYFACTWTYVLEADGWKVRSSHNSYPEEYFRAVEGDTLFLAFLDVKPESKEEFERLSHEMLFDKISEADKQAEFISTLVRMLHPTEANDDGTFTYLFMFDPTYAGEYNFTTSNLYTKIYGEEKGKELDEQFAATLAGAQKSYMMIQSRK